MYFADSRKESFSSWSCHHKKLSIHLSVTLTKEFVPYWLNLAGGTMKRQCVHFQRLHIFSNQTSKLIGKYSNNCNCFQWWPSHWVQTRPARMTLESLLQSSLWITGVKNKNKNKNDWSQTFILFPSWVVFWLWLDAHNLMRGLPLVYGCICKPETVSVWYLDSTWLHLQKLSHLRQIVASYRILHR